MSDPINPISKLFKPPVDPRSHREQRIPRAVQNSADFWVEVFMAALSDITSKDDIWEHMPAVGNKTQAEIVAHRAREIADAALVEFEDRWPGIKL